MDAVTAQTLQTWFSLALDLLTLCTLFVLIWYTVVTVGLRRAAQEQVRESVDLLRESQKQTEQAVMPVLIMTVDDIRRDTTPEERDASGGVAKATRSCLVIKNVGQGPTLNSRTTVLRAQGASAEFHHRAVLAVGQYYVLRCVSWDPLGTQNMFTEPYVLLEHFRHFDPSGETISTKYMSVTGRWYETVHSFETGDGGNELIINVDSHRETTEPTSVVSQLPLVDTSDQPEDHERTQRDY